MKYSKELKDHVVNKIIDGVAQPCDLSSQYPIPAKRISIWVSKSGKDERELSGLSKEEVLSENNRLRMEIRHLSEDCDIPKKATALFASPSHKMMTAVTEMVKTYPVKRVCEVLEVSRSMYWRYWKKAGKVVPARMDVVEIFEKSRKSYGSRRLAAALGERVGYINTPSWIGTAEKSLHMSIRIPCMPTL